MAVIGLCYCVTLWHMSIGAWVVAAISFQEINAAPHTEASTQCDHQGLKGCYCGLKKSHIVFAGTGSFQAPKGGGGFRSGNSFSRIAPPSPGSVSGVKVSVIVGVYQKSAVTELWLHLTIAYSAFIGCNFHTKAHSLPWNLRQ